ncbi:hypothetical protein GCM10011491_10810 [Brucella endophytica]|uniref:Uncharacterized protein n=1 Tax=Brucella endophytica TaxID=1963359 RepID=A0A916S7V0_9HYPH|nr:hypothetical protein GCM10011491_10810 [Brucella endophytica]
MPRPIAMPTALIVAMAAASDRQAVGWPEAPSVRELWELPELFIKKRWRDSAPSQPLAVLPAKGRIAAVVTALYPATPLIVKQ